MSNKNTIVTGQVNSILTTGTMPINVISTTACTNLNVTKATTGFGLKNATTTVDCSAATAPGIYDYLVATSSTAALWRKGWLPVHYGATSVNTSVGTDTLTTTSSAVRRYTGSTGGMNVRLPVASGYNTCEFIIINDSSVSITVDTSLGTVVTILTKEMYILHNWFSGTSTVSHWIKSGPVTVA